MHLKSTSPTGDAVKVHVSNLIEPVPSRLVRSLDQTHVEVLQEELRQVDTTFCVVVGVYFTLDEHTIKELESPCNLKVEVIGGNHTRGHCKNFFKRVNWLSKLFLLNCIET